MLQLAPCCTFNLFHNHQTNNLNWDEYSVYLTKQPKYLSENEAKVIIQPNLLCIICIIFLPFCKKENSQTRTVEKDVKNLYARNCSGLLRHPKCSFR